MASWHGNEDAGDLSMMGAADASAERDFNDTERAKIATLDEFIRDQEDVDFHGFGEGTACLEAFFESRRMDWRDEALWDEWIDAADEAVDAYWRANRY